MTRRAAEKRGRWGEMAAAYWLRLRGWRILGRRVRVPIGEIDLIAKKGGIIAFIEVKTRSREGDWATAIDKWRLRRVAAAAAALAPQYARHGEDIRIDVILVARFALPRHLTNVWHG